MRTAFLVAHDTARQHGQTHVGTEHVFLAILLDPHSIPSQMLNEIGVREQVMKEIETLLASEPYNRPVEP